MLTARSGATATLLDTGEVLVAGGGCNPGGGDCDAGSFLDTLRSAELYDPTSATWTKTGSMTFGREYFTATLMPDGRVLVAGGLNNCDDDFCKDAKGVEALRPVERHVEQDRRSPESRERARRPRCFATATSWSPAARS